MMVKLEMCEEDVRLAVDALEEAAVRGYDRSLREGGAARRHEEKSRAASMDYVATRLRRAVDAQQLLQESE